MTQPRIEHARKKRYVIKEKGRRGFWQSIFGRTGLILALLLIQISAIIFLFFRWQYSSYAYGVSLLIGLGMALFFLNRPMHSHTRQTWLIIVLLFPVVGALLYIYIEADIGHRLVRKKLNDIELKTAHFHSCPEARLHEIAENEPELYGLAGYIDGKLGFPVCRDSSVTYLRDGQEKLKALLEALESAKDFIFMEYFIIDRGYMWDSVLDVLKRKAAEGVDVRVMYDGTCAVFRLPYRYPEELEAMGIRCKMFSQIRPVISTSYNNRDHRKIAVIDGRIAFTGGINLADEYMNLKQPFGEWKDVAVRIGGEAVRSFTLMFLRMWNVNDPDTVYEPYLNAPVTACKNVEGYVIPYADSPFDNERVGEAVFLEILYSAKRYVHIMTPYLIIDETMTAALTFAAKRGVDVKLILPHHPDKKSAFSLAYTHYRELIEAGVQIYEFTPGFVHAKVFVSDDCKAVVGTINLDYRSLYLHFEDAVLLWKTPEILKIELDYQATLARSERITKENIKSVPGYRKVLGALLKVFSPLM